MKKLFPRLLILLAFTPVLLGAGAASAEPIEPAPFDPVTRSCDYPDLFERLDLNLPQMKSVQAAVAKEDWPAAEKLLADFYRQQLKVRYFQRPHPSGEDAYWVRSNSEIARRMLNHEFYWWIEDKYIHLGEKIDWRANPTQGETQTVEFNSSLNRHPHFVAMGREYKRTGDERYVREIAEQMIDWTRSWPRPKQVSNWSNSPYKPGWNTLHPADQVNWNWTPALLQMIDSPNLTDQEICAIVWSYGEKGLFLDELPPRGGNKGTREQSALYIIGTLFSEFQQASQWRKNSIQRIHGIIAKEFYPDGMHDCLCCGYVHKMISSYVQVLDLAQHNNLADELPEDFVKRMEAMYNYQGYAMMPDGLIPGFSDSFGTQSVIAWGAGQFPDRKDFAWLATRGAQGEKPKRASTAFPYTGHYIMRSGFDKDARFLMFDSGPLGTGHYHQDKLNLVMYAYGKPLLLEAGNYSYDSSRYRLYAVSTRSHNTIRVDGQDQSDNYLAHPKPWNSPPENSWFTSDDLDYVRGSYTAGYGSDRKVKVDHTRSIIFVKPNYWIVVDSLNPADDEDHVYENLWHINAKSAEIDSDTLAVASADPETANLQLLPVEAKGWTVEIVQGRKEEPVQGWAHYPIDDVDHEWIAVPTAVYKYRGKGPARIVTVVTPSAPRKSSPIVKITPLAVTLLDGTPADDAIGLEIQFQDGSRHQLLHAETAGTKRKMAGVVSDRLVHLQKLQPEVLASSQKTYLNYETLKKHYDYDASLPFDAKRSNPQKVEGGTRYELTLRGHDGMPIYGDIVVPEGAGPFPVLVAPSYMTDGFKHPTWFQISTTLAKRGVLTAWLDFRIDGRGKQGDLLDDDYVNQPGLVVWARKNTILDFRRLLDYVFATYEVDNKRICYAGSSKAGMMGAILGAVDPRVKQFALRAAGADVMLWMKDSEDKRMIAVREASWFNQEFFGALWAPYDCQYFAHKLSPRPVLFQFGKRDTVVPTSTFRKMDSLVGEPKEVIWYDGGHGLSDKREQAAIDVRRWLAQQWHMPELNEK